MDKDAYPLLLVLIRSRGSLELISVIEGKSTTSEVLLNLIQSHELFEQQRQRDADEEIVREKREDLKKQQEDEYNRSLKADLAKEKARLDDERKQKDEKNANERLKEQRLVKFFFVNMFIYIFPIYLRNNNENVKIVFLKNQVKQKKILHD
jgi:hypothetical protein